ncbi:MAG TPA: aspartate kinase, partial [Firmicutes bacterium]|nr:aspartate kinase [Bacillota bacterium]
MAIIVQKYGGSSVADTDKIQAVARRIVDAVAQGHQVVAVVSAQGKTTDALIAQARAISSSPPKREMDMLLATGEQVSIALLAMAIDSLGQPVVSLTGAQGGIMTDTRHTKARIRLVDGSRIREELKQGKVVIVAGFQGITSGNDITTLGRGGSDTTAVAVAA